MFLLSYLKRAFGLSLLSVLAFYNAQAQGQAPDFDWAKVASSVPNNWCSSSTGGPVFDSQGNYYLRVGTSGAGFTTTYDGLSLQTPDSSYIASQYIIKYGPSGNVLWTTSLMPRKAPAYPDAYLSLLYMNVDAQDNLLLTGRFSGEVSFGTISLSDQSSFLAKYNPAGTVQWVKTYDGIMGKDVESDAAGNLYWLGWNTSSNNFNGITLGYLDAFIAKYTPAGNLVWSKKVGYFFPTMGLELDNSGNIFVQGGFDYNRVYDGVAASNNGSYDTYLAKYSPTGNRIWWRVIGGAGYEKPNGLGIDAAGNVYTSGMFIGTVQFGSTSLTSTGGYDIYLTKHDPNGTLLWAKKEGGNGQDDENRIKVKANGDFYLIGNFTGTATYGTITLTSAGQRDIFLAKYNTSGTGLWALKAGGPLDDSFGFTELGIDASGNHYLTGQVDLSQGATATFGGISVTGQATEGFLVKLNATSGAKVGVIPASICKGATFSIPFTAVGSFSAGNRFIAQLSSSTGSFATPVSIGEISGTSSGTINATLPATVSGVGYKIRIVAISPQLYGTPSTAFSVALVPATPGVVSGQVNGVCANTTKTYSIAAAARATGYTWTAPVGAAITNGQNTTSVTVSFGAGFTTGTISVKADNSCGSSGIRSLAIKSVPGTPGVVTGPVNGVCANTTKTYSIAVVTGATGYVWTAPAGASITSGQGTTSVTVSYSGSFTSGSLIVKASNGCGLSNQRLTTIKSVPSTPAIINGAATVCRNQAGVGFNIAAVTGATNYVWTVPAGAVITSGQGTTAIQVTFGPGTGSLLVSVKAGNGCGYTGLRTKAVTVNSCVREMVDAEPVAFSVYPNPSTGTFTISYSASENGNNQLQLFDMTGRLVKQQTVAATEGNNNVKVEATDLPKGMYIVELVSGTEVQRQRVVIE